MKLDCGAFVHRIYSIFIEFLILISNLPDVIILIPTLRTIRYLPKLGELGTSLLFSNNPEWEVYCLYFTEEETNAQSE